MYACVYIGSKQRITYQMTYRKNSYTYMYILTDVENRHKHRTTIKNLIFLFQENLKHLKNEKAKTLNFDLKKQYFIVFIRESYKKSSHFNRNNIVKKLIPVK